MSIQEILNKLNQVGCNATQQQVEAHLKAANLKPEDVNDQVLFAIAEDLSSALAVAQSSGMNKGSKGGKATKRTDRTPKPGANTGNLAQQVSAEIGAFEQSILQSRDAFVNQQSARLVSAIAETPNLLVQKFGEDAANFEGNPEFFRSAGREFADSFFPVSPIDAA